MPGEHLRPGPADDVAAAEQFLMNLPAPWTPWPQTARSLAPVLATTAAARGWHLGTALRAQLTDRPDGIRSHPAVLSARIRQLPNRPPPARCASCGAPGSLVHANGQSPRPVCVPCATVPAGPPSADPAAQAAAVRSAIRAGRRARRR
ncbi:hypothetical protein ACFQ7O_35595 [Streptomyces sp. NPDC056485]|uniref:hypothetical protein n=1 Tax=Streptomyces sp. NPDC056485 TaxID=3345834 RepID=UPI0036BFBDCC